MAIEIVLPTFHAGQAQIYANRSQRNAVRCGRRFGKTKMMVTLAGNGAVKGRKVGLFAPEHKQLAEPFEELLQILYPLKRSASRNDGTIRTFNGGLVDFWYTNDNPLAGRGREYDLVLGDEMAFTKNGQMAQVWDRSINPTMLTKPEAPVWLFSTPNGIDPENFFWQVCRSGKEAYAGFKEHYAPSDANPAVGPGEMERERRRNHPLVFEQEYLANFVDWSGVAFFAKENLLVDGLPVQWPAHCDNVFCVIDSAVKGGREHDGTAVSYWATSSYGAHPLVCLDWDIISVDGALLERWMPSVFHRLRELALACGARFGVRGAFIEDAQSGSILLQQCIAREWDAEALPAELTAAGKDGRAMNASAPVHRGEVKFSEFAYDKTVEFHGIAQNHLLSQVSGYRIGDKDAYKRADDLADTFTYAIAIGLGNSDGFA